MKSLYLMFLIGVPLILSAQTKLEYINPEYTYQRAINSYQDGNTEYALYLLERIDENDSIYIRANIARTSILLDEEQYEEVIVLCDSFIHMPVMERYSFYINKGVAQLRSNKYQEAIETFNNALKGYPMSYLLYYNLGNAYENNEDYNQAIEAYQKAIILNPYYAQPHYRLGGICYHENHITQAVLCWNTCLLLSPDSETSLNILIMLNEAVSQKNENMPYDIIVSEDDRIFSEIDLIVNNYAALSNNYKISNKIKLPVVKQNHAIMEKLVDLPQNTNDFWCRKYVPFYQELFRLDYFDDFIYRILIPSSSEEHQKIIKKNARGQEAFLSWAGSSLVEIMGSNNSDLWGSEIEDFIYSSEGVLIAVGQADQDMIYNGPFIFYNSNGSILSKGFFTNDQRDKDWVWYREDGSEEIRSRYVLGVYQGEYSKYFKNGNLMQRGVYNNDYLHGMIKSYNIFGALVDASHYNEGVFDGLSTTYYDLGENFKHYEINYKDGLLEGKVLEFFPDGSKKMEMTYNAGKPVGEELYYFNNETISYRYAYKDGALNGKHTSFYSNGNLQMEGQFTNGFKTGVWKLYYPTGTLSAEENYDEKGNYSGSNKGYSKDGKLYERFEYENGEMKVFTFYDSKGNIIKEGVRKDHQLNYEGFDENGTMITKGTFENGVKEGEWKYYNTYGVLDSRENYEQGNIAGKASTYFVNGDQQSSMEFIKGIRDGYYVSHYINGKIESQGYYKNDQPQRIWLTYYPDGALAARNYLKNNQYEGFQYVYSIEGDLAEKQYLENGSHHYTIYYDSLGCVIDTLNMLDESVKIYYYPDSSESQIVNYAKGYLHGKYMEYHPNKKIATEGAYYFNNMDGIWKWWDDQGHLIREINFDDGNISASYKNYHPNGRLASQTEYYQGQKHGWDISYSENGDTIHKVLYIHDDIHGPAYYSSDKGELQLVRYYHYGALIGYSYAGTDGILVEMIPIENGTGDVVSYYENGMKARSFQYLGGEFDGEYCIYYSNGNLSNVSHYTAGFYDGEMVDYYPDQSLKSRCFFVNDMLHGPYVKYHPNGKLAEEMTYVNGGLSDYARYYDENGNPTKVLHYYNDMIIYAEYY